jgi:hypothetical protein
LKARNTYLPWMFLFSVLFLPNLVVAQPYDPPTRGAPMNGSDAPPQPGMMRDPTIRRHFGFFFRPELGFGYAHSSASSGGGDLTVKGGGGSFALAVGGAVLENFIVGAQVWDVVSMSPTVEASNGSTSASAGTSSDASSGVVGYGLLLNWYLPNNVYLALTPSFTRLAASDGDSNSVSEWGFGARAALGKEWWVSNHWGIGAAGGIALSSNKDSPDAGAPSWTTLAFSVSLSATYN